MENQPYLRSPEHYQSRQRPLYMESRSQKENLSSTYSFKSSVKQQSEYESKFGVANLTLKDGLNRKLNQQKLSPPNYDIISGLKNDREFNEPLDSFYADNNKRKLNFDNFLDNAGISIKSKYFVPSQDISRQSNDFRASLSNLNEVQLSKEDLQMSKSPVKKKQGGQNNNKPKTYLYNSNTSKYSQKPVNLLSTKNYNDLNTQNFAPWNNIKQFKKQQSQPDIQATQQQQQQQQQIQQQQQQQPPQLRKEKKIKPYRDDIKFYNEGENVQIRPPSTAGMSDGGVLYDQPIHGLGKQQKQQYQQPYFIQNSKSTNSLHTNNGQNSNLNFKSSNYQSQNNKNNYFTSRGQVQTEFDQKLPTLNMTGTKVLGNSNGRYSKQSFSQSTDFFKKSSSSPFSVLGQDFRKSTQQRNTLESTQKLGIHNKKNSQQFANKLGYSSRQENNNQFNFSKFQNTISINDIKQKLQQQQSQIQPKQNRQSSIKTGGFNNM